MVEGTLDLHGVTQPVSLDVEFHGVVARPLGTVPVPASAPSTEINRKDFGIAIEMPMETGGVVVGDKIKIHVEVELVLQAQSQNDAGHPARPAP